MILRAILAVLQAIAEFIFSLLPDLPSLPDFVTDSIAFFSNIFLQGAGVLAYFMGETLFHIYVEFIENFIGIAILAFTIKGIKKLIF